MKNALHGATMLAASFAIALVTALGVSGPQGFTSQGNVHLPTTGTYSSLQAVGYMNDAWDALLTCNKGPAAPVNALGGTPKAGQCWLDDSNATLLVKKRYSGAGWVVEGVVDVASGVWSPPVGGGAATVTAAAMTDLCALPAAFQTVTGTTTISSFGSACASGVKKTLVFTGAATLTYSAISLILPGQTDYLTSAGDVIEAVALGSGNWRVTAITKISGNAVTNPAVPVSTVFYFDGAEVPPKYALGYGQALPRADYPDYLAAVTRTQAATRASGSDTLTVADTSKMGAGMPVEGAGIQNGTTIVSVTPTTIKMSANATSSGVSNATVFLHGYGTGGGATTVGVRDCRGRVLAGRDDMGGTAATRLTSSYFAADGKAMGASGGSESKTLLTANLPPYTPSGEILNGVITASGSFKYGWDGSGYSTSPPNPGVDFPRVTNMGQISFSQAPSTFIGAAQGGTSTPSSVIQPTGISDCIVRVLP